LCVHDTTRHGPAKRGAPVSASTTFPETGMGNSMNLYAPSSTRSTSARISLAGGWKLVPVSLRYDIAPIFSSGYIFKEV
jgi:hypothetical protein